MAVVANAMGEALQLLTSFDAELLGIVALSLQVSLGALILSAIIGLPIGAALALYEFPGRRSITVLLNALMGLPPVVAGLFVYLALSHLGPFGFLDLLFTPTAMVIAQTILITPIVAALTRQLTEDLWREYGEQLRSLGSGAGRAIPTLLWDGRYALVTVLLAGLGRAMAEVGAVIIVGGNIAGYTRVMTTTIALETSKGNLSLALGLGIVLMLLALIVNAAAYMVRETAVRQLG
jgi:tungstate transport system permease protein